MISPTRTLAFVAAACWLAGLAAAQEVRGPPSDGPASAAGTQAAPALDTSIAFLEQQVQQAVEVIEAVRAENDSLRLAVESLEAELATVSAERGEALRGYEARLARTSGELAVERENGKARASALEVRIRELADVLSLERSETGKLRSAIEDVRKELAATLARRDAALTEIEILKTDLRAREEALETAADQADRERGEMSARLIEARDALETEKTAAETSRRRLDLLNRQLAALRDQIAALNQALGASDVENTQQRVVIADLGSRLNQALASRVAELAKYRSEFLGRLRIALGERSDVRIVGERFVFQSEVLFASGEADLNPQGRDELKKFASTLKEVSAAIPPELGWVLRVDGHTDRRPIATPRFPSNWELSTARAISVVKFLAEQGLPVDRLAATGFAEHHPLDDREDEIGYRRNRRIEFLLTQR